MITVEKLIGYFPSLKQSIEIIQKDVKPFESRFRGVYTHDGVVDGDGIYKGKNKRHMMWRDSIEFVQATNIPDDFLWIGLGP